MKLFPLALFIAFACLSATVFAQPSVQTLELAKAKAAQEALRDIEVVWRLTSEERDGLIAAGKAPVRDNNATGEASGMWEPILAASPIRTNTTLNTSTPQNPGLPLKQRLGRVEPPAVPVKPVEDARAAEYQSLLRKYQSLLLQIKDRVAAYDSLARKYQSLLPPVQSLLPPVQDTNNVYVGEGTNNPSPQVPPVRVPTQR